MAPGNKKIFTTEDWINYRAMAGKRKSRDQFNEWARYFAPDREVSIAEALFTAAIPKVSLGNPALINHRRKRKKNGHGDGLQYARKPVAAWPQNQVTLEHLVGNFRIQPFAIVDDLALEKIENQLAKIKMPVNRFAL